MMGAVPVPPDATRDRWLLIDSAAAEAGVSRRSIYNWIKAGAIETKRTRGGSLRVRMSDIAFKAAMRKHGTGITRPLRAAIA